LTSESITATFSDSRRIVVTGGGTGGHISPIVAVVEHLRECAQIEFTWIGSYSGPERGIAAQLDIPYYPVHTGKFRRYLSWSTPADAVRVPTGVVDAVRVLRAVRPDVVLSSGGFVGVPAVIAARLAGIPSITHEQTAHLGLATRINSRFGDVIALSFQSTPQVTRMGRARVIVTGNPVRELVTNGDPARGLRAFCLAGALPFVYVTGGIQGASAINQLVADAAPALLERLEILHQCGPTAANGEFPRLLARRSELSPHLASRYRLVETIGSEIGDVYAAASLVVARAGAGTVAELAAVGKPSVLIPLPGAKEQRRNALTLVDAGGAIMLPQVDASPEALRAQIERLIADPVQLTAMGESARTVAPEGAVERLTSVLMRVAGRCD
jgi:UDP-N-acetylglucosamine--N-acetylmuramyl-(pentapeptide) pyrophosphoryl-undecaprenol N-acetylglucosamine transferase